MAAARAFSPEALPTLLTSRSQLAQSGRSFAKEKVAAQPLKELPEESVLPFRVRNTFIDTSAERSPSLERFYREREVSTCPSAHIGRLRNLFQQSPDSDSYFTGGTPEVPCEVPYVQAAGPVFAQGATAFAERPTAVVLSLAQVLGSSPPSLQEFMIGGGQAPTASCYAGGATYAPGAPCQGMFGASQFPQGEQPLSNGQGMFGAGQFQQGELPLNNAAAMSSPYSEQGLSLPLLGLQAAESLPAPPDRPALGSEGLPTVGSAGHAAGTCKPCAFFHTAGCASGLLCQFCHLCEPGEKKRRRKDKLDARRTAHKLRQASKKPIGAVADC